MPYDNYNSEKNIYEKPLKTKQIASLRPANEKQFNSKPIKKNNKAKQGATKFNSMLAYVFKLPSVFT